MSTRFTKVKDGSGEFTKVGCNGDTIYLQIDLNINK